MFHQFRLERSLHCRVLCTQSTVFFFFIGLTRVTKSIRRVRSKVGVWFIGDLALFAPSYWSWNSEGQDRLSFCAPCWNTHRLSCAKVRDYVLEYIFETYSSNLHQDSQFRLFPTISLETTTSYDRPCFSVCFRHSLSCWFADFLRFFWSFLAPILKTGRLLPLSYHLTYYLTFSSTLRSPAHYSTFSTTPSLTAKTSPSLLARSGRCFLHYSSSSAAAYRACPVRSSGMMTGLES